MKIHYNPDRILTKKDKKKIDMVCKFLKTIPLDQRERYCETLARISRFEEEMSNKV